MRCRFNQYMQTMDLYWQMKLLLGQAILYPHETCMDIIHSLENLHKNLKDLDWRMEKIE